MESLLNSFNSQLITINGDNLVSFYVIFFSVKYKQVKIFEQVLLTDEPRRDRM